MRYHVVTDSQSADVFENGPFRDVGPVFKQHWINVTCLLVCRTCVERFRGVTDPYIMWVIGQGRLSRPMKCLRSRSAAFRMFLSQLWLWRQRLLRTGDGFSKSIYIIAKYCIDIKKEVGWRGWWLFSI